MHARLPAPPMSLSETERYAQRMELLQMLIDETVFQQFLFKNVPPPDPTLIKARITELDTSLKAKGKTLAQFYADTGQSEARLTRDIDAVIRWNAYVKKKITDDEVKRYYTDNKELFDGVMIRASHIFLRVPRNSDQKVQQVAVQKLQAVRQEIVKGTDFAEAAKKHSQDQTAANGGDLGYFPPSRKDADPFLRAVSAMKAGELSDVVQTDYGFHLIKVVDRKPGKPTTLEDVKDDVRMLIAEEMRLQIIAEQRKAAKVEVNLQ
jgi:parvulin-like peptidyl-prolyl isomerase